MKKMLFAAAIALIGLACGKATDTGGNKDPATQIQGVWLSTGADVAPLLAGAPFNYTTISAAFAESSYVVDALDSSGKTAHFEGTYTGTATTYGTIREITLNQTIPTTLTSQGIYQVDTTVTPNRMTYEVVQTQPPLSGVTPPTAMAGFGSTSNGAFGQKLVQKYSKQ